MNKAKVTLTLFAAALALAGTTTAVAAPKTVKKSAIKKTAIKKKAIKNSANRKLLVKRVSPSKLWQSVFSSMARVQGTITVDAAVLPHITGQCKDVVIKAFAGSNFGDEVSSMRATGDISSGSCSYTMFVSPKSEMRLLSFYEGTRSPDHPGDYLEINGTGPHTFAANAGSVYTRDFVLTYDFIK